MPLEWSDLWRAMAETPNAWQPTTESMFDEMLGAVPPARMGGGSFLVGEPADHNAQGEAIFACFKRSGSSFFAKYQTIREWEADR